MITSCLIIPLDELGFLFLFLGEEALGAGGRVSFFCFFLCCLCLMRSCICFYPRYELNCVRMERDVLMSIFYPALTLNLTEVSRIIHWCDLPFDLHVSTDAFVNCSVTGPQVSTLQAEGYVRNAKPPHRVQQAQPPSQPPKREPTIYPRHKKARRTLRSAHGRT